MSATSKLFYALRKHPAMQTPSYTKLITEAEAELLAAINYINKQSHYVCHSDVVVICEELLGLRDLDFLKQDDDGNNWVDPEYNDSFKYEVNNDE
jgi:hypothetical protein